MERNAAVPVDQNYDGKAVGFITLSKDTFLTADSILVPEVGEHGGQRIITGWSIIDRDNLITKEKRDQMYGNIGWKDKIKV